MIKADLSLFLDLASSDQTACNLAAESLDKRRRFHFHDHPVGKFRFSDTQVASLVVNWRATDRALVKVWIGQVLALAESAESAALAVMADTLALRQEGAYIGWVASHLRRNSNGIANGEAVLCALHDHPNDEVRWQVAHVFHSMTFSKTLDYERDMPVLRAMLRDRHRGVRSKALDAVTGLKDNLQAIDYEALLDFENAAPKDSREAVGKLLLYMEGTVSGCSRSSFAKREPLLSLDGVYVADHGDLSTNGEWISNIGFRFLEGGQVEFFGTNIAPVDHREKLPDHVPYASHGTYHKSGSHVAISVRGKMGACKFTAEIDGRALIVDGQCEESGKSFNARFEWRYIDWAGRTSVPTTLGVARNKWHFIPLAAQSMRISDAAKWYLKMQALIPGMLESGLSDIERVESAWRIKTELRKNSGQSLHDPSLRKEFFHKLPIPDLEVLQAMRPEEAMKLLLTVTKEEVRAFPGTVGEAIGMTYWDGKNNWVMTENGWELAQ